MLYHLFINPLQTSEKLAFFVAIDDGQREKGSPKKPFSFHYPKNVSIFSVTNERNERWQSKWHTFSLWWCVNGCACSSLLDTNSVVALNLTRISQFNGHKSEWKWTLQFMFIIIIWQISVNGESVCAIVSATKQQQQISMNIYFYFSCGLYRHSRSCSPSKSIKKINK